MASCRSRLAPSMSTFGSTRSSQRGRYHARPPSSVMTAGTIVMRTTNASMATPNARAKPIALDGRVTAEDEPGEDRRHDEGGRGDHAGAVAEPADDRLVRRRAVHVRPRASGSRGRPRSPSRGRRAARSAGSAGSSGSARSARRRGAPASHPHWNTATTAPNVAATLSRKPSVALSGTRRERNDESAAPARGPRRPRGRSAARRAACRRCRCRSRCCR